MATYHAFFNIKRAEELGIDYRSIWGPNHALSCGLGKGEIYVFPARAASEDNELYRRLKSDANFEMRVLSGN